MNPIQDFLNTHSLKSNFDIGILRYHAGRTTLKLLKRNPMSEMQLGMLGSIVDCAARLAGHATVGESFISECEMSIHTPLEGNELVVSAKLSVTNQQIAAFHCEIHSMIRRTKVLVAESHGTLVRITPDLSII